jgi:peroxiredoxin
MPAQPPVCDFGAKAPDFELPATDGRRYSLADIRGPKGFVIVFICNHCPYVKAVADKLAAEGRALAEIGVGMAAICSNDAESYPADSFENMKAFAAAHGFPFPYLHDEDQSVARAYGAVCTPDFFGYDAKRRAAVSRPARRQRPGGAPGRGARALRGDAAGRRDRRGSPRADAVDRLLDQVEGRVSRGCA